MTLPMLSSMSIKLLRVLVADDNDDMRSRVTETLQAHGCVTLEARNGEEVLDLLVVALDDPVLRPDVIVAEVRMPRLSGLGVLAALRRANCTVPVIMTTIVSDDSIHTVAKRNGAVRVLNKPFDLRDLLVAVQDATTARLGW